MTTEETRNMFAAHALQGMMANQISRDEIIALSENQPDACCPFAEAAWTMANAMMELMPDAPV